MMVDICYNSARRPFGQGAPLDALAPANTGDVRAFHRTFREYAPTPLHDLPHLAGEFGLGRILIKDESRRFGLNAFKVLGASYAIGRYLAEKLGRPLSSLDPDRLRDPGLREKLGDITFATTTDAAWPGRPGRWGRRPWSTCPGVPPQAGWRISALLGRNVPSLISTTTTPCA